MTKEIKLPLQKQFELERNYRLVDELDDLASLRWIAKQTMLQLAVTQQVWQTLAPQEAAHHQSHQAPGDR